MASTVSDRIFSKLKSKPIPLNVQRYSIVGDSTAAVLFQTSPGVSFEEFASSVDAAYEGKLRVLPGSPFRPSDRTRELVQAFVEIRTESRPADEEGAAGLTMVSASVFENEEDHSIWVKTGEGETARLMRQSEDDLEAILDARQCGSLVTASAGLDLHEEAKVGQAIGWYDFARETMRYGVKLSDKIALETASAKIIEVEPKAILLVGDTRLDITLATTTNDKSVRDTMTRVALSRENMISKYMAFAKTLYAKHGPYFKKLTSLLETQYGAAALR